MSKSDDTISGDIISPSPGQFIVFSLSFSDRIMTEALPSNYNHNPHRALKPFDDVSK